MSQPSLDRSEWKDDVLESRTAGSRIRRSSASIAGDLVLAIVFNGLTWPSAYFLWRQFTDSGRISFLYFVLQNPTQVPLILICFIFPVVSLVLAFRVAWRTVSAIRYGRSTLTMNVVPAPIGGQLLGTITAQGLTLRDDQDILLRLECRALQVRNKAMDETEMSQQVEWSTARVLSRQEISKSGDVTTFPVHLPIPQSGHETGETIESRGGDSDTFSWSLVASVEPGPGWNGEFEIPVRRTAYATPATEEIPTTIRPRFSHVVVYPASPEGVEIRFVAAVKWRLIVGLVWLATLPLFVTPWILFLQSRPGAAVGWLVFAFVINGGAGYMLLRDWPRRLVIGPEWITVFYRSKRRRIPTLEAGKVDINPQGLSIAQKGQTSIFKSFFVVTPRLSSVAEARWLKAEIERALALYR